MRVPQKAKAMPPATLVATLLYAIIAVIMTYPVAFKLSSAVAGAEARDNFQWIWFLWWGKKAWLDLGTSVANLETLYYPTGAYHPLLAAEPYVQLLALPLASLFGPIVAYNFEFLLSFLLSGLTMYLLCAYITRNRCAAFIGGLIFGFFPWKTAHAVSGHFAQIMIYWFPVYALFLFKLFARPNIRNALLCGLFLTLSLTVYLMHIAYFVIPFTLLFLVMHRQGLSDARLIKGFVGALLLAALLSAPFLLPIVIGKLSGQMEYLGGGTGMTDFSVDLLAFLSPPPYHPVLSLWEKVHLVRSIVYAESMAYLGLTALCLALWGVKQKSSEASFWLILGISAAILSLGPFLKVGGELVRYTIEGRESYVVLPYALLTKVPFFEWGRTPGRLSGTMSFALAVLASLGAGDILPRLKEQWPRAAFVGGIALLVLFEYVAFFPFPIAGEYIPDFYRKVAEEPEDYAILDLPVDGGGGTSINNRAMYYQMFHRHRIISGFIHRWPAGAREIIRFFSKLCSPLYQEDIVDSLPAAERFSALRALGFKYLVIHKTSSFFPESLGFLHQVLGRPRYEDERIVAFTLPEVQDMEVRELALLDEEDNWYGLDVVDGQPARWMSNDALVWFYETEPARKRLLFTILAWGQPELEVFINEQLVQEYRIDREQTLVTSPVFLRKGVNRVRFHLPGRCLPPQREGIAEPEVPAGNAAGTCITAQLREIRFLPAEAKEVQHPFEINLGGEITFLGYDLWPETLQPGEKAVLILYWRAERQMEKNYTVFVHLLDGAVRKVSQDDRPPLEGAYPTSCWEVGEVVGDRHVLAISPDVHAGEYELKTGLYLLDTMERLAVAGDATGEAAISLGTIVIDADK